MNRRLRCRLGLHKWVLKQDSRDAPRYYGCCRCDEIMDSQELLFLSCITTTVMNRGQLPQGLADELWLRPA